MVWKRTVLAAITLAATALPAMAGEGKFSALMFGDAYWVVANHDSTLDDMNGLWIRRVYLTYDHAFSDVYSARVRLEAQQPGDFETVATIPAFIKEAWLKWEGNGQAALIGVQETPGPNVYEDIWAYRAVEKTPIELQLLTSSRDGGIAVMGDVGENNLFGYHVMVGNGSSVGAETNPKKRAYGSLRVRPAEKLVLEAYGDYEDRVDSGDRVTYFGLVAYDSDKLRAGAQYIQQTRMETGEDLDLRIASAFIVGSVSETVSLYGRVDRNMDPNPQGDSIAYIPFDPTAANTFFVGGLDFLLTEGVNIMPNVEAVVYDEPEVGGPTPDTDVIARLTFQAKF